MQSLNVWPTAQGLFANTLEFLWEFSPVKDTTVAAEDKDFASASTQQDNVLRAHQLAKWMSYFLVAAWEYSTEDATNIIFPSFGKVGSGRRARSGARRPLADRLRCGAACARLHRGPCRACRRTGWSR